MTVPREEFETEIDDRIKRGGELLERTDAIQSQTDLIAVRSDFYTWNDYNRELLTRRFTTSEVIEEYSCVGPFMVGGLSSLGERVRDLQGDIQQSIRRLESIKERITLIPEAATVRHHDQPAPRERADEAESIFIIHGHDEALKLAVHGFLRDVTELDPVILHDEPNMGRTIIEKFEAVGGGAAFEVVLLTSEDIGRSAEAAEDAPFEERARQNVVLELGFFVGAFGSPRPLSTAPRRAAQGHRLHLGRPRPTSTRDLLRGADSFISAIASSTCSITLAREGASRPSGVHNGVFVTATGAVSGLSQPTA